jgi:hypothetical protein
MEKKLSRGFQRHHESLGNYPKNFSMSRNDLGYDLKIKYTLPYSMKDSLFRENISVDWTLTHACLYPKAINLSSPFLHFHSLQ